MYLILSGALNVYSCNVNAITYEYEYIYTRIFHVFRYLQDRSCLFRIKFVLILLTRVAEFMEAFSLLSTDLFSYHFALLLSAMEEEQ